MADARVLLRGVLTVTGARIVGLLCSLVQIKLSVLYLGPIDYGHLMVAVIFIQSLTAWTDLGVGNIVVRRISGNGDDFARTVGLGLAVGLVLMVPTFVVANVGARLLYPDQPDIVVGIGVLSVGLLATTWATSLRPVAQVSHRFGHYAAADVIGRLLSLGCVAAVITLDLGLRWFFIAQLMVPFGQVIAMMRLGRLVGRFRPVWNRRDLLSLMRESLPLSYVALVATLYYTVDGLMLSKLSTAEQVGAYALAYRIVVNLTIVSTSAASVLASRFAEEAVAGGGAMARTLRESLGGILLIAAPLATLVFPLSPEIVRLVGSEEMVSIAAGPLIGVSIAVAIGMITSVCSVALIAAHQQRALTILNTVTLVLNVVLNLVLIPMFDSMGAAAALVASESVGLIACTVLLSRRVGAFIPARVLLRLVPALAASLALEYALRSVDGTLRILLVGVGYAAAVVVFRVVDLRQLRALLRPAAD